MIILTKVTQDGAKHPLGINILNLIEVTPNPDSDNRVWIKYWDGSTVRSAVCEGTVESVVQDVMKIKRATSA